MADNRATVTAIYEAFGRGDVDAITELTSDEVSWDSWQVSSGRRAAVPWLRERRGKDGVREFFAALAAGLEITDFRVVEVLAGPDTVAAEIEFDATVRTTGRAVHVEEMHLWRFDAAGEVVAYRDYLDPVAVGEALQ